jgi:hypothetical protein
MGNEDAELKMHEAKIIAMKITVAHLSKVNCVPILLNYCKFFKTAP